jgi:Uma2 family endonuclease
MTTVMAEAPRAGVVYPESDGKPMAENTKQGRCIRVIAGNLGALFRDRPDVFVAADNFWYPKEGFPDLQQAPDVYVVFGRPKGDRGSYKQWEEDDVPLTVVFEVLSPSNTVWEMADKLAFYDEHGVEEYYIYDPDNNQLAVYLRGREALRRIALTDRFASPRLGIRFDLSGQEMAVFYPDGRRFLSFEELDAERQRQQQRADNEQQRADKAERELARLRELSGKVVLGQASAEEVEELKRIVQGQSLPS